MMSELLVPAIFGLLGIVIGGVLAQRREDRKTDRDAHMSFLQRRLTLYSDFSKSRIRALSAYSDWKGASDHEIGGIQKFSNPDYINMYEALRIIQISCDPTISDACSKIAQNTLMPNKSEDLSKDFETAVQLMRNDIQKIERARTVEEYFGGQKGFWKRLLK